LADGDRAPPWQPCEHSFCILWLWAALLPGQDEIHDTATAVIDTANVRGLDALLDILADKRVIYIGESHDRYEDHLNQLGILRGLKARGRHLAIGMEFFQQPFQPVLDAFVAGTLGEADFLKQTEYFERWRFDYRLYRPLLRFAREHGIPVIIRDNLSTLDLPTTAGAAALRGHEPLRDAFVVQRLREAGAVILAKANMSELTLPLGRFSYSSAAGQSRNPYNLRRAPSSAADAAALAANLGMLAVGTDTAGSLRGPAAVSAVVGLKPTLGLTSRSGLLPTALSIEVTGPLARSVRDAALLLNVIAAEDPSDPRTADPPDRPADYTAGLAEATLDGVRLGVARAYGGAHKEVDAAFTAALDLLRAQGAELLDAKLPDVVLDGWELVLERLIETEFRDQVNAYLLHTEQGMPHSLAELLRMSASPLIAGSPTPTPPGRLDAYRRALRSPGLADLDYLDILSRRLPAARTAVTALFTEHELDALVLPTMLCPASSLLLDYDESYHCAADRDPYQPAYLASIAGLPELTLPMGFTEEGLPLGVSLVGPAFSEARLLALGHAFEQVAKVRRAPEIPDAPPPVLETLPEED